MIANKYGEGDIITSLQSLPYISYDFMNSWVTAVDRSDKI